MCIYWTLDSSPIITNKIKYPQPTFCIKMVTFFISIKRPSTKDKQLKKLINFFNNIMEDRGIDFINKKKKKFKKRFFAI